MQKIIILLAASLLGASSASAEQPRALKFDQANTTKALPLKQPRSVNSCAAYGGSFVKVGGTNTCVRIGGSIEVGAGGSVGGR